MTEELISELTWEGIFYRKMDIWSSSLQTPAYSLGADESGFRTIFDKQYQLRECLENKILEKIWEDFGPNEIW